MSAHTEDLPELMPVLSRGRHRSPRRGACFMEYASWLAGESWSDHPACTHPAVAMLARLVNDRSSDAARNELVTLIPSVVGLLGDENTALLVAAQAASAALPVVSEGRQRVLAAGLVRCEELLGADSALLPELAGALDRVPLARSWAKDFITRTGPLKGSDRRFLPDISVAIIRTSVDGIAEACIADPDERMRALLTAVIERCRPAATGRPGAPLPATEPSRERALAPAS